MDCDPGITLELLQIDGVLKYEKNAPVFHNLNLRVLHITGGLFEVVNATGPIVSRRGAALAMMSNPSSWKASTREIYVAGNVIAGGYPRTVGRRLGGALRQPLDSGTVATGMSEGLPQHGDDIVPGAGSLFGRSEILQQGVALEGRLGGVLDEVPVEGKQ